MQWTAQPRQAQFLNATEYAVLYGGARGGGKTDAALIQAIKTCSEYPGSQAMLLRRNFQELNKPKAAIPRSFDFLQGRAHWTGDNHRWTFKPAPILLPGHTSTGSVFQFGHLSDSKAIHTYLGTQTDLLEIDQAEEVTYDEFSRLKGSNRATGATHHLTGEPLRPLMRLTANPGGVGQAWLKMLFIDAAPPDTRYWVDSRGDDPVVSHTQLAHAQTYRYVPAKVWDNPALLAMDPEYVDRLYSVGGTLAKAWVDGNWDSFAGQFFSEFSRDIHVCKPMQLPPDWPRWMATDYGYSHPSCTLWLARNPLSHRIYVYRERFETKKTAEQQAMKIHLWSGDEHYRNKVLDPSCWKTESNGLTIAAQYAQGPYGVDMAPANNDRKAGWLLLRRLLQWQERPGELDSPTFAPTLQIMSHCINLVRTLPNLMHDPMDPEDALKAPGDDACDTLRYGVMSMEVQADKRTPVGGASWGMR